MNRSTIIALNLLLATSLSANAAPAGKNQTQQKYPPQIGDSGGTYPATGGNRAVVVVALSPLAAMAHEGDVHTNSSTGGPAPASAAKRTVTISSTTKYVNVDHGDIVKFEVDGKTFTWQFDPFGAEDQFDLSAIAPADVNTREVRVYVATNPLYQN